MHILYDVGRLLMDASGFVSRLDDGATKLG